MRKIVVHMQSTLNNRIANSEGGFWEPFPWGEEEQAYINTFFRGYDTFALSRVLFDAIVPWWDGVATGNLPEDAGPITLAYAEFAALQHAMAKVVFSRSMQSTTGTTVISGDLATQLAALKQQEGADILLAAGPETLGPLASTPGLIDEYLIVLHPAVIADGPQLFSGLTTDLALELIEAKVFDAGCVGLGHRVIDA